MKLKCGIEIHQRLATRKLFCKCPSELGMDAKPLAAIARKQHAVMSELGEVDRAAQFEYLKGRTFIYEIYPNCCEVELDEAPPLPLNSEALEIALEVCAALHAEIVDEVQVMRKTVIDGSNTSGFQRTALIGLNGWAETSAGRVSIPTISLEEESAGIVREENGKITYRLDRLGIPLIEIGTGPEIVSPAHAREVAEKIGTILRLSSRSLRLLSQTKQKGKLHFSVYLRSSKKERHLLPQENLRTLLNYFGTPAQNLFAELLREEGRYLVQGSGGMLDFSEKSSFPEEGTGQS